MKQDNISMILEIVKFIFPIFFLSATPRMAQVQVELHALLLQIKLLHLSSCNSKRQPRPRDLDKGLEISLYFPGTRGLLVNIHVDVFIMINIKGVAEKRGGAAICGLSSHLTKHSYRTTTSLFLFFSGSDFWICETRMAWVPQAVRCEMPLVEAFFQCPIDDDAAPDAATTFGGTVKTTCCAPDTGPNNQLNGRERETDRIWPQ